MKQKEQNIQYFFVPIAHEKMLTEFLVAYTSGNQKRTIVSAIYQKSENFIEGMSSVFNRTQAFYGEKEGRIQNFAYSLSIANFENGKEIAPEIRTLIGFVLKGDILAAFPEAYQTMLTQEGVQVFDSSEDLTTYLHHYHLTNNK